MDKLGNQEKVVEYKTEEEMMNLEYYKLFATLENYNKRTKSGFAIKVIRQF